MHECRLCSRDMKTSKDTFGNTCVRNIYSFLEMNMPRKMNLREITLYNNVMKINKISNINTYQKVWLTDRYLTQQYLNKIPYGNYTRLINQINFEMKNINQLETEEKPKSSRNMTLKQAYNLYKKATRFAEGIENLKKGNFTDKESIKLIISSFSFIFNMKKNSNQYEKNTFKAMQYAFWQSVIEIGGKYAGFDISADLLQHSLEKNPKDIYINDGKIVQAIIDDKNFKNNINNIIESYGKNKDEFSFDSNKDGNFAMSFGESDLYFAIHNTELRVEGKKQNENWILDVKLHDRYDYSKFKSMEQYFKDTNSIPKSMFSSTLYNLAYYSIKFGVMKEYDIDIHFKITDKFEVIDE